MYITNRETDPATGSAYIIEYSLSTPFDISTANISFSGGTPKGTAITCAAEGVGQMTLPHAIEFKSDGTMMYVMDNQNKRVEQFTLSEAWNSATLSHDNFFAVTNETQIRGLAFKPDGTRMYVIGAQKEIVYQYTLTTPWDVATAGSRVSSPDLTSDENDPRNIQFNSDGTIMYIGGSGGDEINKYTLSSAYAVSYTHLRAHET